MSQIEDKLYRPKLVRTIIHCYADAHRPTWQYRAGAIPKVR
jgi:hypothetical protein